ncbi:biopolymer transporter ExbD [Alkalilimnicola ehrlichii]|uniref:Biopolymer transporter ExbD n=1 Tax=Alkalilimnicola ehrlichii TaxID=351052 RepID=A0A3E0WNQ4_9GAMM|nr:biopolymer transporter ExbD [Alkalilimnicola ehrlichii]RFA33781.1 biopolymer transporter ExbD [Alkalilimnicola ehrlichii]
MNLRPKQQEEPEINLTPLIDVVFLMLIFFMVTTTFIREGDLELNLPEASLEPSETLAEPLELVINAQGDYFLDGQALVNRQARTVRLAIEQALSTAERGLVVRADAATPHQAVVTALDAAGQAGVQQISIATVPQEND